MPMSEYVRRVRSKIGNEFLLMPSVTALVFDSDRRVLLVRPVRRDVWVAPGGAVDPDEAPQDALVRDVWVAPGGAVDPDEAPQDALVREVWEETGLLVEPTQLLGVFGGPEYRVWYGNGDEVGYMMAVYECRATGGALRADGEEIAEARYFFAGELPSLTLSRWARIIVPRLMGQSGPWLPSITWKPPA
jgi:8-oxo-dGTP pyrophosphatase MutT (NUDIX family)